jgi:hypothetical protein
MEAKLDALMDVVEKMDSANEKLSARLDVTRDKVNDMESKQKGAWFVVGIVASVVSWLVSTLKG